MQALLFTLQINFLKGGGSNRSQVQAHLLQIDHRCSLPVGIAFWIVPPRSFHRFLYHLKSKSNYGTLER